MMRGHAQKAAVLTACMLQCAVRVADGVLTAPDPNVCILHVRLAYDSRIGVGGLKVTVRHTRA